MIQKGAKTLPNKLKLMHHSAAFKVQEKDISKGSMNAENLTGAIQTDKVPTAIYKSYALICLFRPVTNEHQPLLVNSVVLMAFFLWR